MSCESAYTIVSSLWKKYGDEAILVGCAAASAATANPELIVECVQKANKAEAVIKKIGEFWQSMAGDSSWATLGPRMLRLNETEKGKLTGTMGRRYITPDPLHFDSVKVFIREADGKAKTSVKICLMNPDGKSKELKAYLFNEDKKEKKQLAHQDIEYKVSNAKGKYLIVHFDAKSVADKFEYAIRLEKVEAKEKTVTAIKKPTATVKSTHVNL